MPGNKSSEENPLVIILDNVNRTQEGCSPTNSFVTIAANNYVIVKLRGTNTIVGGEEEGVGSNDGTAGIHVSQGATLKVTSEQGDGSTEGSITAKGGGSKYGGAGIGCSEGGTLRGTILISGGNVTATGGHEGVGIGSGDGAEFAKDDGEKGVS
ncbi:MAG: hypothetical protein IKG22_11355 [Atopobiaceae bacterium]|nr:hypothetical protein [Atopobiaceae bacterium]